MKSLKLLRYFGYILLTCVIFLIVYTTDNRKIVHCDKGLQKRILIFKLKNAGLYNKLYYLWIDDKSVSAGEYLEWQDIEKLLIYSKIR